MIKQLGRVLALGLAFAAVSACDDGTDPIATAAVEVLAYIDANSSNSFDAADDPIAGATVTLTQVGATQPSYTDETGSDGVATFPTVEVGTYTAAIQLPAALEGVTLVSASAPTVVVSEDAVGNAEFRYTYNPGSVTGTAFLGTGDFTEGAPTVPGVAVELQQDGSTVAETVTEADGTYEFTGVLPGSYTAAVVDVPAYLDPEAETKPIMVEADAEATVDFGFSASPTHTVAEARAAEAGTLVAVTGVAITGTAGDEAVLSGSSFYLQDESGISIFLADVNADVRLGDEVLVYGERGAFRSEVQISSEAVLVLGEGTLPEPLMATVSEVNQGLYQGQLVTLDNVYVERNEMDAEENSGDVWVEGRYSGEDLLVYVDGDAGIDASTFTEDTFYDMTGVAATFEINGVPVIELKPRMPADISEAGEVGTTLADVRAAAEGEAVTVTAAVTEDGTLAGNGFYLQDATAGIFVFVGFGNVPDLAVGDIVMVTGERGQFFDIAQISGDVTVEQTGDTSSPDPTVVGPATVAGGDVQGELVRLVEVTVDEISGPVLTVSDEAGTQTVVFLDSDAGVGAGLFEVGGEYTITGVVSNFRGTEQVVPRSEDDIEGLDEVDVITSIAEARTAEEGLPVELTGVLTVQPGNFGGENYIQDEEAGIALFRVPDDEGYAEGDVLRVEGNTSEFQGNIQISVSAIEVIGSEELPEPVAVSGSDVNAGANPGEVVVLDDYEVTEVVETNDFGSQLVTGTADGETVQLFVDNRTGIATDDWTVGTTYTVTGIMNFRDPGDSEDQAWRIKPRKPADVVEQ